MRIRTRKQVTVDNDDDLKAKLQCFSIKPYVDGTPDPLSKEEKDAVKSLLRNPNIAILRPDKGGGVVMMDRLDYRDKLRALVDDTTKFEQCPVNQSDCVKK